LKLLRLISLFLRVRKIWVLPNKCDALIFDAIGSHPIEVELVKMLSPFGTIGRFVLPDNGEVNIPILLASILKRGNRFAAYCDSYIQRTSPRLVITYIDNNNVFYSVAARNPAVKTMFIQNGSRNNDSFDFLERNSSGEILKVDFMLIFGNHIGSKYAKYISGSLVPIGSFRNNHVPRVRPKMKGTLSFVSQYRDHTAEWFERDGVIYKRWVAHIILPFLVSYAEEKGLQFRIISNSGRSKDSSLLRKEKSYYKKILGSECEFFKWEWHGSSYDAIDSTEVVVSNDSTLGLEAMARGTKSAIFSFRSTMWGLLNPPDRNYGWPGCYPDEGPFWTNNPSTESFRRILDHLFTVSDEQWCDELEQHGFQEVMQYDPDNTIIRDILANEMKLPPISG